MPCNVLAAMRRGWWDAKVAPAKGQKRLKWGGVCWSFDLDFRPPEWEASVSVYRAQSVASCWNGPSRLKWGCGRLTLSGSRVQKPPEVTSLLAAQRPPGSMAQSQPGRQPPASVPSSSAHWPWGSDKFLDLHPQPSPVRPGVAGPFLTRAAVKSTVWVQAKH